MNLRTKLMKTETELHSQQQQMCHGILMLSSLKIPMTFTFTEKLQVLMETLERAWLTVHLDLYLISVT